MTGVRFGALAVLGVAVLFAVSSAAATTGALDPSFGTSGIVTTGLVAPVGDSAANALLLQPDGKLIAVGDSDANPYDGQDPRPQISLVRYNPDGTWDPDFGTYCVVRTTTPGGAFFANAAVLQPDGKIVVAGYYWPGYFPPTGPRVFALFRYNPDGSLDSTFGSGGIVTTSVGPSDSEAEGVVLQLDGKIVAGGVTSDSNGSSPGSALVRYNPDGTLDASFGTGGIVLDTQKLQHGFSAIALQPDGKILGVGEGSIWPWTTTPLTRFHSNGTLDSTFGSGGASDALTGQGAAMAVQPDGKIVVAGANDYSFYVARVDPDGTADPTFDGGTVTTPMGFTPNEASAVALQPDSKIVVAGWSQGGFTVVRYKRNGLLDPTFGRDGIVTTLKTAACPCWANAGATSMALQSDGKIDVAGWAASYQGAPGEQLTVARYVSSSGGMLTVLERGPGTVTSNPIGVDCGTTCSDLFAAEPVTLTAMPAAGSVFKGWSGACSGKRTCQIQMTADRTVTATFSLAPARSGPACVAPKTKGKSLTAARRLIKRAHCRTGTVKHSFSKLKKGHVISQTPGHGRHLRNDAKINLRVSKGNRQFRG